MCVKYLDDLWATFPTNPFSTDFEMATVYSLSSFIGRIWEKRTRRVELGHWKISSCVLPSYHTKAINFSRHIGRGRREEPEKLIPNPRSCKCSLTSLSTRSEIVSSPPLWLKLRRIFPSSLIWEKNAKSARQTNYRGWELSFPRVIKKKHIQSPPELFWFCSHYCWLYWIPMEI